MDEGKGAVTRKPWELTAVQHLRFSTILNLYMHAVIGKWHVTPVLYQHSEIKHYLEKYIYSWSPVYESLACRIIPNPNRVKFWPRVKTEHFWCVLTEREDAGSSSSRRQREGALSTTLNSRKDDQTRLIYYDLNNKSHILCFYVQKYFIITYKIEIN